mmetsp:Transcript_13607/g.28926  ORF Transcript_13607/g.28926 Transcript_13607/m.28926 type:complete len:578 (-) Transcript_13607:1152-2885(-)
MYPLRMSSRRIREMLSTRSSPQLVVSSSDGDDGNGDDVGDENIRRPSLQRQLSASWEPRQLRRTRNRESPKYSPSSSTERRLSGKERDRLPSSWSDAARGAGPGVAGEAGANHAPAADNVQYVQVRKKNLNSAERGSFHRQRSFRASERRSISQSGLRMPSGEGARERSRAELRASEGKERQHKNRPHEHQQGHATKKKQTDVPIQEHVTCSNYLSSRAEQIIRKKRLTGKNDGIPSVIFFSDSSLNGTLDTACSTIETVESSVDFVANTIEEYNLMPVPAKWLDEAPHLRKICKSNQIWEAYEKFRSTIEYNAKHRRASKRSSAQLIKETYMYPFTKSRGGAQWPKCSYTEMKSVEFNRQDEIKLLDVSAVVFSPIAVPRAIEFGHHYEVVALGEYIVAVAKWKYRTIYISPTTADGIKKGPWMTICSTRQQQGVTKRSDVAGLSQESIAAMRNWLIGTSDHNSARSVLDDFDFLRFVFASTLTPLKPPDSSSRICMHSISRSDAEEGSSSKEDETHKRRHMDELRDSFAKNRPISWLEYEVRKATGRLRPRDQVQAAALGRKSPIEQKAAYSKTA